MTPGPSKRWAFRWSGRLFSRRHPESPKLIIVDEARSALGAQADRPATVQTRQPAGPDHAGAGRWFTVVGVVREIRMAGFVAADDRVGAYYRRSRDLQDDDAGHPGEARRTWWPVSRGGAVDRSELPLFSVMTLEDRMSDTLVDRHPNSPCAQFRHRQPLPRGDWHLRRAGVQVSQRTRGSASAWRSAATRAASSGW